MYHFDYCINILSTLIAIVLRYHNAAFLALPLLLFLLYYGPVYIQT